MSKKIKKGRVEIPVIEPSPAYGLTEAEANERAKAGLTNTVRAKSGKSYLRIIADNLFTFFNLIWAVISGVLIAIGAYDKLLFATIILANTLIAIVQESRAKRTVEKLSMVTAPRGRVLREGKELSFEEAQTCLDLDRNSRVVNPRFKDRERFVLRADSPALAMGFRPIDISDVGPRGKWKDQ